jgi:hypothetical protein
MSVIHKKQWSDIKGAKYVCIWESELKDKNANTLLIERLDHARFSL